MTGYDVANRLVYAADVGIAYAHDNKRVWEWRNVGY
jgi:hypothetical protein